MILDYNYNKTKRILTISYIKENGHKDLLKFNVSRFKSYYSTPSGKFQNWDGSKCDIKWVDNPDMFDLKTYIKEIDEKYRKLLQGKTNPKLYTFDIETEISDEFPEPSQAKFPITTISIANSNCDVIVLGTKQITSEEYLTNSYKDYLNKSEFFNSLKLPLPNIKYVYFDTEEDMLRYFLKNIVANVPVLAGWNSIGFDWQYIQNRIRGYYPNLSFSLCSIDRSMSYKNYTDMKNEKYRLSIPNHTLILDMMDVVENFDLTMGIKESMSLDYIASTTVGLHKIQYDGDLQKLFNEDYDKYVFYNAIDSVLVQLIDKKLKTLSNIYTQALYCEEKIGMCFSKIALSEALIFNDFYERNIKIAPIDTRGRERGELLGAYVRTPLPGKHNWIACCDFSSLYPSTIMTCNLSYDNFIGVLGINITQEQIEKYKNDPSYFVSVNNCVYKNDKDYSFKRIQKTLKENRAKGKYLAKDLDAIVITDIDHILKKYNIEYHKYSDRFQQVFGDIGYSIKDSNDLLALDEASLKSFESKLKSEIVYYTSYEQSMKLLANSMYGGISHVSNFFYNMHLANDITGEGRNLIHLMEKHIPQWFKDNWLNAKELHKELGIKVKY